MHELLDLISSLKFAIKSMKSQNENNNFKLFLSLFPRIFEEQLHNGGELTFTRRVKNVWMLLGGKKKGKKNEGRAWMLANVIDDSVTGRRSTRRTGQRGVSVAGCRVQETTNNSSLSTAVPLQRCAAHVVARISRLLLRPPVLFAKYNLSSCVVNSFNVVRAYFWVESLEGRRPSVSTNVRNTLWVTFSSEEEEIKVNWKNFNTAIYSSVSSVYIVSLFIIEIIIRW